MLCNGVILRSRQLYRLDRNFSIASALQLKSFDKLVTKYLVNNNKTKKSRVWHQSNPIRHPSELAQPQMKGEKNAHRLHVLNTVFLKKICDLLSTGQISSLCSGYGLEISKVEVLPGMTAINVHWFCTDSDLDNTLENTLRDNAYSLRHELSMQRVIGRVPPIHFVKDHRYFKLVEVERRLATADFGEDFEPNDPSHHVKSIVMRTEFDDKIKMALGVFEEGETSDVFLQALTLASSNSNESEEWINDLPLDVPAMRNNILGVNTEKIFTKVKQSMVRARAEHRRSSTEMPPSTDTLNLKQGTDFLNVSSRTVEIREWASNYQKLNRKGKRGKDKEMCLEVPRTYISYEKEDIIYEEEEDYFDENIELDTNEKF